MTKDKYKLKLPIVNALNEKVVFKVELLKVGDDKVCADFTKADGDCLVFYKEFGLLKEYLGNIFDTVY